MNILAKVVSPLEKVFYDDKLTSFKKYEKSGALLGERHSFEVAYVYDAFAPHAYPRGSAFVFAEVTKSGKKCRSAEKAVKISLIEHVPSVYPAALMQEPDEHIRSMPGLFPDVLIPCDKDTEVFVLPKICASLWVDFYTEGLDAGDYEISIVFTDSAKVEACRVTHKVHVIGAQLPEQEIAVTHWLHTDCIADYYNIKVFSKNYWKAVEDLFRKAVDNGTNVIYTPLFTPPLDTNIGGERTTVQLLDVKRDKKGNYTFGFERFEKWVALAKKCGGKYFEMSHLFTQWGAFHAPKILCECEDGKVRKIFGWETDSHGAEYEHFLSQLFPALNKELISLGIDKCTFFHISDEPSLEHLESYKACRRIVEKYLGSYKILDAMGKTEFYTEGLVDIPVPFVEHADGFFALDPHPRFVYYCGTSRNHMGRTFGLHSSRNRLSGLQFYAFQIEGFLQWGFNFYNSVRSLRHIDPYAITDADKGFCSGDSFLVYPAPGYKFYDSIRLAVFGSGIEDLRAMKLCEKLCGREAVMAVIRECNGGEDISLHKVPKDKEITLKVREKINAMIEKNI